MRHQPSTWKLYSPVVLGKITFKIICKFADGDTYGIAICTFSLRRGSQAPCDLTSKYNRIKRRRNILTEYRQLKICLHLTKHRRPISKPEMPCLSRRSHARRLNLGTRRSTTRERSRVTRRYTRRFISASIGQDVILRPRLLNTS